MRKFIVFVAVMALVATFTGTAFADVEVGGTSISEPTASYMVGKGKGWETRFFGDVKLPVGGFHGAKIIALWDGVWSDDYWGVQKDRNYLGGGVGYRPGISVDKDAIQPGLFVLYAQGEHREGVESVSKSASGPMAILSFTSFVSLMNPDGGHTLKKEWELNARGFFPGEGDAEALISASWYLRPAMKTGGKINVIYEKEQANDGNTASLALCVTIRYQNGTFCAVGKNRSGALDDNNNGPMYGIMGSVVFGQR